ncbi:hypothetical protein GQ42DRAFT_154597 [Ramicandelaber brevisporus]|nr:hypothetical protein GQ42DRAFT_154597 [Ramicandelaber brevisporus]
MSHTGPAHDAASVMVSVDPPSESQPLLGEEPADDTQKQQQQQQQQQQQAAPTHTCAHCHCHSPRVIQVRVVELPVTLMSLLMEGYDGTVSLLESIFAVLSVVVFAIARGLRYIAKTRIFIALLSVLVTLGIFAFIAYGIVLPRFWARPDVSHLNAVWNRMDYAIRDTEAWSVLSEQPAHCLAADQSHAMPKQNFITRREVHPTGRHIYGHEIHAPDLYIRAGGQMRSNIVVQTDSAIDRIIIEYSVAHNGTDSSFIQDRTKVSPYGYGNPVVWLNAGDSTYYQWKSSYPRYPAAPSCAYTNITITMPTNLRKNSRLFIAATRPNIEMDDSVKSRFRAIRVVEPIEKQLSDFTVY